MHAERFATLEFAISPAITSSQSRIDVLAALLTAIVIVLIECTGSSWGKRTARKSSGY